MKLGPRLQAVADFIQAHTHADIGSDHALLPKYLLQTKRICKAIVIEKHQTPFENSRQALTGYCADIRLGDGLAMLQPNEAESLSVSGLGASKITRILKVQPEKLPNTIIVQPNDNAKFLRVWARANSFHLVAEEMVEGYWRYTILKFEKREGHDPVYDDVPLESALTYGPHLLKTKHPLLHAELEYQHRYFASLGRYGKKQLEVLEQALDTLGRKEER